jgi:hypothetical protein
MEEIWGLIFGGIVDIRRDLSLDNLDENTKTEDVFDEKQAKQFVDQLRMDIRYIYGITIPYVAFHRFHTLKHYVENLNSILSMKVKG